MSTVCVNVQTRTNNFKLKLYLLGQLYSESGSCLSENSQDVYSRCHLIGFAQPSGIQWSVVGRKRHNTSTYHTVMVKVMARQQRGSPADTTTSSLGSTSSHHYAPPERGSHTSATPVRLLQSLFGNTYTVREIVKPPRKMVGCCIRCLVSRAIKQCVI